MRASKEEEKVANKLAKGKAEADALVQKLLKAKRDAAAKAATVLEEPEVDEEELKREKKKAAKREAKKKAEAKEAERKWLQAKEEKEKKVAAAERKAKQLREAADAKLQKQQQKWKAREEAERRRKKAEAAKARLQKRAVQARQDEKAAFEKALNARLEEWRAQQAKRRREADSDGGPPAVERVPKLSALLAMGGPEAEEYKKKVEAAKLANWKGNAGGRWEIVEQSFEGRSVSEIKFEETVAYSTVELAVEEFCNNPERYLAMHYWREKPGQFTYILRNGTVGYEPKDVRDDKTGRLVLWRHMYKRLEPLEGNLLPVASRDEFTDAMTFGGKKLHSSRNRPLLPGRGMGIGDEANMEAIGDGGPQPAHVRQGACVGDCWLLSAIACLADFDWAVHRLFRKTEGFQTLPQDPANRYTVTLWDLKTWKEVDVVVDERLPVRADGSGFLLGARPSQDGKFWVPYLEKAIAAHCGGYDKLNGTYRIA